MIAIRSFLLLTAVLFYNTSSSQGFLKAEGTKITNDKGEIILRGMGLGGWMLQEPYMLKLSDVAIAQHEIKSKIKSLIGDDLTKRFYQAWLSNHCTKADIDSLAAWGFNSVRLPMHYNLYTLPIEEEKSLENTWLTHGFELTDSLLSWCKANKIYLILDLHAAPGGQGSDLPISDGDTTKPNLWNSDANKSKTVALWGKLAERYANEPWIGAYDILNEPNYGFRDVTDKHGFNEDRNEPLRDLYKDITAAIRKHDQKHLIIIEGNGFGNNYNGMFPLWDDNMALSFHKYWNYNDAASLEKMINYRELYKVPVWVGETGENSNSWFTDAIILMEKYNIGWNLWPLKKSGINNPLQVVIPKGYQKIINYWNGEGQVPEKEFAFQSLMEFAHNTHISKNIVHHTVVDAIIRQTKNNSTKPFKQITVGNGNIVYASDYDMGRGGFAYHDADSANYWVSSTKRTTWNEGHEYRNDGVDIEKCEDEKSNGYNIGWISDGDWTQYTVTALEDGMYNISLRISADKSSEASLIVNNKSIGGKTLPITGSMKKFENVIFPDVKLKKGQNKIRVFAHKGGFNFCGLIFEGFKTTFKKTI